MQTAAISYRVADFLKQHPPFHCMEEPDLLALVSHGRVRFHESDEFLCWQNTKYSAFLFVIQQGAVSLWEESGGKELLRDIRGPGDMIGIERFLGSQAHPHSAKANGDVVVYALQAADFEPLLGKYPQAARYVEAHAAAGAVYRDPDRSSVHKQFVVELARHPEPLSCTPDCSLAEAARTMRTANADAVAVMVDEHLLGVLTTGNLVEWVANGGSSVQPIKDVMSPVPPSVAPNTLVSDCVLAMNRSESNILALTADGTSRGGLLRLISAAELQPAFGDNPVTLLEKITQASDIEVLRILHLRARAFLLTQLTEPSAIDWLSALGDRINVCIVKRLVELAGNATTQWCWCFYGAAARRELLAAVEPEIALLCDEESDLENGRHALWRLRADLAECGYLPHAAAELDDTMLCATTKTWQERFTQWIRDPILSGMYDARPLFDLRPAFGNPQAWQRLEETIQEALRREPGFQKLLANDCLSALPPLTFFQNEVVDESGERTVVFDLENRAIGPIVEVGRVFGIGSERFLGSSTLERLEAARSRTPADGTIFRAAGETLRVLLYLQARSGLRLHQSGHEIQPSQLSRMDRQALTSGFRAIHDLLQFTVNRFWNKAR